MAESNSFFLFKFEFIKKNFFYMLFFNEIEMIDK